MKKYFPFIFTLLFLLCSCSINDSTENKIIQVSPEVPFELKVNQTAEIEGHQFTFKEISSDSRCPIDAKCIWTGEATVVLVSEDEEKNIGYVYLSTNSTEAYVSLFPQTYIEDNCINDVCSHVDPPYELGYLISLNSLSPDHEVGVEIHPSEYVANLTIYLAM